MDEIRTHIEKKFADAQVELLPFPHLIIEDFFPDDVYEDILRFNPYGQNAGAEWLTKEQSRSLKTGTPYYARKQINFHKDVRLEGPPEGSAFWDRIKALFLADPWFDRLVYDKWPDYFLIRFGELCRKDDFFGHFRRELFLQRHEPGYYIGPHTDIATRVFTCIFSFASQPGFEAYGTELLRHRDELVRCWGNNHYLPDDFIVAKLAPYKPNNFLLFYKTRQSFHSVRAIDDSVPNQRFGMQYQFYEPPGGLFRDLSEPDLMALRHSKEKGLLEKVLDRVR